MRFTLIITYLTVLWSTSGFSVGDSSVTNYNVQVMELVNNRIISTNLDSTVNKVHTFYPSFSSYTVNLGNLGTPIQSLYYSATKWSVNFIQPFEGYGKELLGGLLTQRPYTKLFYSNGTSEEQYFRVIHSQRLAKLWNVTAEFNKISSTGFYSYQKTDNTIVSVNSIYSTRNGFYNQLVRYSFNSNKCLENGGLASITDFENDVSDKQFLSVELSNASNKMREHNIEVQQFFGKENNTPIKAFHFGEFSDSKSIYFDADTSNEFYNPLISENGFNIYDSVHYQTIRNSIGVQNFSVFDSSSRVHALVYGGHEFVNYYQNFSNKQLHSFPVGGTIYVAGTEKLIATLKSEYFIGGYRANNYTAELSVGFKFDSISTSSIWITSGVYQVSPNYRYSYFANEAVSWNNNLEKERMFSYALNVNLDKTKTKLKIGMNHLQNKVYLDSLFVVSQNEAINQLFQASLKQHLSVYKFHLDLNVVYQKSFGKDVFRVPEWLTFNSIYFESFLFSKASLIRIGVDGYYTSAFYGNGYQPFLNTFYFQDKMLIGDYIYFDVFAAAQIKKARVFVKVTHVNSGLMGNRYYTAYKYPAADRMIRLGVDWTFWD